VVRVWNIEYGIWKGAAGLGEGKRWRGQKVKMGRSEDVKR
jgi:hypothetical protein